MSEGGRRRNRCNDESTRAKVKQEIEERDLVGLGRKYCFDNNVQQMDGALTLHVLLLPHLVRIDVRPGW